MQQAVTESFLRLVGDASGQSLLKAIGMGSPVAADFGRDYRPLERYRLDKYVVLDRPA